MSSRALRRAQRELEEKQLQQKLAQEEREDEPEDSEEEVAPKPKAKASLFAVLGHDDHDQDEDEDDPLEQAHIDLEPRADFDNAPPPKPKKSKKKKKKAKSKAPAADPETNKKIENSASGLDEIDQALIALNLTRNGQTDTSADPHQAAISEEMKQMCAVLSVDSQHLHAANEMKKLFGRAALQTTDDQPQPRQRGRGQQGGLAAAVAGRNAPGSRNLASLSLRRNIFIQGKEEWPRATSGGLAMEVVEKRPDGIVEYRFAHNRIYQEVQQQFQVCVGSMDPERMVQLLHFNPYHISTLLQVSEIAKQQHDNATASELLERALFTFGRSVHSTFLSNLATGKARLDFRRPENREFWLAIWRYIGTLTVRATWRTALEWAKLMLVMDPEQDPYCIRLLFDQLALRGRDPQAVVDLVETDLLQRLWKVPPNLAFSVALAHDRLKQPQKARSTLRNAIKEYPWLAARLCKELDISPIPKPVWGKEPSTDYQEILCQLYTPKAKDLWNTAEATSLLVEVCYSFEEDLSAGNDPYWLAHIPETDLARHIILSDDRNLMALLDTRVKAKYTSVSDPLPPDNSIQSYDLSAPRPNPSSTHTQLLASLEQLREYFHSIQIENLIGAGVTEQDLVDALEAAGSTLDEFRRNTERFQTVRARLQEEGVQVVFDQDNARGRQELEVESESE
ncbi:transcriptional repressor TCF25-domain-containing protein [Ampelomyces quisqualis]|uniref:Transcriptional repressor TCF25-domain-containing protein n=1 Tax=Ampelomyces quisqualis TaxID=50730 RepID=A0A6A5R1L5_AMPQU|nr:transcriptional repressor TCF25-domain-containing protein [Ampelomyces quisqualis]